MTLAITIALTTCFVCYSALCALVVLRTGTTTGLPDLAKAVRGFTGIFALSWGRGESDAA